MKTIALLMPEESYNRIGESNGCETHTKSRHGSTLLASFPVPKKRSIWVANRARRTSAILASIRLYCSLSGSADFSRLRLMSQMEKKTLSTPDEKRSFDKGQVELVTLGGVAFGRATLQPGWKWSTCVKPLVNTESCQAPHLQYHVSGRLRVRMDDGSEDEFSPGEVSLLPPGHDAWVVGNEPVVVIDISGMTNYAKPA